MLFRGCELFTEYEVFICVLFGVVFTTTSLPFLNLVSTPGYFFRHGFKIRLVLTIQLVYDCTKQSAFSQLSGSIGAEVYYGIPSREMCVKAFQISPFIKKKRKMKVVAFVLGFLVGFLLGFISIWVINWVVTHETLLVGVSQFIGLFFGAFAGLANAICWTDRTK